VCYNIAHAELSSRVRSGRVLLLLHSQSAGATADPARRPYRHLARGRRYDPAKSSLHHRCVRRLARSPACGLDAAARRRRFLDSLAPRQGPFCQGAAKTGTAQCRPRGPQRTRHLAASVLGASDPRRGRLRAPCRILLHQSGQARTGHACARLAAFVVSSRRARGFVSGRLGRRCRITGEFGER
jgi:hypothetical protein